VSHAGNRIDLHRYFTRTGCGGATAPTPQTLADRHLAHVRHIPFENLDVLLGRPIRCNPASLEVDLVARGQA
jgi:N-hydroxyarylamine O-acetyltransferase